MRPGKGHVPGSRVKTAAIERKGQMRRDVDVALRRQIAQKRHRQPKVVQLMRLVNGLIHKIHPAAAERQVIKRKSRRLVDRLRIRLSKPREDVVNAITPCPR